jgi:pteridine reductase
MRASAAMSETWKQRGGECGDRQRTLAEEHMELQGKLALVTGAARRVGKAIALELARAGCDVAVHYCSSEADAQATAAEIRRLGRRAEPARADLADPDAPIRLIADVQAALGPPDILVNNAAAFWADDHESLNADESVRQLKINLLAPMLLCAACWPSFQKRGAGKIVNLCDARLDQPMRGYLTYTVSKAGLVGLTRSLARSMAPVVQVNGVAPGAVAFPDAMEPAMRESILRKVPLRRQGGPEDVARVVRFLVGEADYVTGQIWLVDGGRCLV